MSQLRWRRVGKILAFNLGCVYDFRRTTASANLFPSGSMANLSPTRPDISPEKAIRIADASFGISASLAEPLPSDRDQNFLVTERDSGRKYVLKLARAGEDRSALDFQNGMMAHLARAGFPVSILRHTRDGGEILPVTGPEGAVYFSRLLTWIPGRPLFQISPQSPSLFEALGAFLGGMDRVLEDFSHPAQDREIHWDLQRAGEVVHTYLPEIEDPRRRDLLKETSEHFLERLAPLVPELRISVIHGDANDHNVLVAPLVPGADPSTRSIAGLVDFGDAVRSFTVGEVAIAGAYAMMGKADPFPVAAHLVRGYHRALPLREAEVAALLPLMGLRLCASVAISAHQKRIEPDDPYLTVSEEPAWALLERMEGENQHLPHYLFREACGWYPVPKSRALVRWLQDHGKDAAPVVGRISPRDRGSEGSHGEGAGAEAPDGPQRPLALAEARVHVFDLGVETVEFPVAPAVGDAQGWTDLLFGAMRAAKAEVGIGRYDEVRQWYTSPIFQTPGQDASEWRTVHLGIDLFLPAGAPVFAPFGATVRSVADNAGNLDYGPTVILEHQTPDTLFEGPLTFWTLYGHLAPDVLNSLQPGQRLGKGDAFARIGDFPGNGNWAPHLHFQIIADLLGREGDFPGVARPSQRAVWEAISPDPNLILGIPDRATGEGGPGTGRTPELFPAPPRPGHPSGAPLVPPRGRARDEILPLRKRYLGANLSIAYRSPLVIVRGRGQYLFDREGQPYLDCVNNVAHVGHNHPRVVEAARRQMALLNTNTRYLHDYLVDYAERLTALLPESLSKVYLVCSGSEANELALRLARRHTGREDVVVVEGGYHGHTSSLIDLSPYKFDGPGGRGPPPWVHKTLLPDPYRGRFRATPVEEASEDLLPRSMSTTGKGPRSREAGAGPDPEYLPREEVGARYADHVGRVVSSLQAEGRAPAAFFCEPLIGCGGQIVPPPGYMAGAYAKVRDAGGICVADEVQVGFGRVGTHFWAFEAQGVVPDIVTLGKPIGNGHPMAAVVTTPEIDASFDTGMEYFNTCGGSPVSCAVGLAVLDVIRDENLQENALVVGKHLLEGLEEVQGRHALVGDARGMGLYLGVELVEDPVSREPASRKAARVKERLRENGILLSTDGPDENVLKIKPPLVFTTDDADRLTETLDRVLGEEEFQL